MSKKLAGALLALSLLVPAVASAQDAAPIGSATKTLGFEKIAAWTERARGSLIGHFEAAGTGDDGAAQILVQNTGARGDFDKELALWMARWKNDAGRRLEKSAVKVDSFDVSGVAVKTAEFQGSSPSQDKGKKERGEPLPGQKVMAALLEGPDGAIIVKMVGPAKTVDRNRDDFLRYVKSAHAIDRAPDDGKKKGKKAKDE